MSAVFDETLLEILVCPLTRTKLRWDGQAQELISDAAGLAYPVRGGLAVMLPEEARSLEQEGICDGRT